jgi:hypothetical protein
LRRITLWFTKSSVLLELGFFPIYMEGRKRTRREGPRGPDGPAPHGLEVGPHGAPSFAPRGSPRLRLMLKVLLHENFCGIFSQIYF